ncbi:hypothetical protein L596_013592 [Steinernema carpocapsae]|uniref:Uncharacterized protein n=1 Tax=Steinernema carpocapsae TaxID=34508 RepID=A0A4U5P0M4_STECR|nr:hypothetical protein L596_013592 [Steinernema carpocapsae]
MNPEKEKEDNPPALDGSVDESVKDRSDKVGQDVKCPDVKQKTGNQQDPTDPLSDDSKNGQPNEEDLKTVYVHDHLPADDNDYDYRDDYDPNDIDDWTEFDYDRNDYC